MLLPNITNFNLRKGCNAITTYRSVVSEDYLVVIIIIINFDLVLGKSVLA